MNNLLQKVLDYILFKIYKPIPIRIKKGAMFGIEFRASKKQFSKLFLVRMQSVDSKETHGASINKSQSLKKGAMFGIDARVTFAVTAIAAFIIGVNQFSDIQRVNNSSVNLDFREIKNAALSYYKDKYILDSNINTYINNGYLNLNYRLAVDPWGNNYQMVIVTQEKSILNAVVDVKYAVLISNGKNAIKDTTSPTNYAEWLVLEAAGDDIILKFDTLELENTIAEIETNQLKLIASLLENYVANKKKELADFCAIGGNQTNANCDIDANGIYEDKEESALNFMLKDITDSNGKYYLTLHSIHGTTAEFKSGYINTSANTEYNMYSFMSQIGGSSDLVVSPRNLVLHFSSNKYRNVQFPYYSEIWYDTEKTVF